MYGGVRGRKTKVGRKLLRFPPTRFAFYRSVGLDVMEVIDSIDAIVSLGFYRILRCQKRRHLRKTIINDMLLKCYTPLLKMDAAMEPEKLCHTLKMAPGMAAIG